MSRFPVPNFTLLKYLFMSHKLCGQLSYCGEIRIAPAAFIALWIMDNYTQIMWNNYQFVDIYWLQHEVYILLTCNSVVHIAWIVLALHGHSAHPFVRSYVYFFLYVQYLFVQNLIWYNKTTNEILEVCIS